jgi:hypothetical protein
MHIGGDILCLPQISHTTVSSSLQNIANIVNMVFQEILINDKGHSSRMLLIVITGDRIYCVF